MKKILILAFLGAFCLTNQSFAGLTKKRLEYIEKVTAPSFLNQKERSDRIDSLAWKKKSENKPKEIEKISAELEQEKKDLVYLACCEYSKKKPSEENQSDYEMCADTVRKVFERKIKKIEQAVIFYIF